MGDATYGCVETVTHRFVLHTPTNGVEIEKTLYWARQEFAKYHGREVRYDNDVWIGGDDETIVIYFTEPEKRVSPTTREAVRSVLPHSLGER